MELSDCGEEKRFLLEQLRQRELPRGRRMRLLAGAVILLGAFLVISPMLQPEAGPELPGNEGRSFSETAPAPAAPLDSKDKTVKSNRWIVI